MIKKVAEKKVALDKAADRFWSFVDIKEEDECWPWKGLKTKRSGGAGTYRVGGVKILAKDMAYQLVFEELPEGGAPLYCGTIDCVNPSHMVAPFNNTVYKEPESVECGIDGCDRRVWADGFCKPHYSHYAKKVAT